MVNFEQLAYVKKIYEMESMIHAAEAIHISQSAMSQSLANLEQELGYTLFHRSRKGTLPTPEGKQLIPFIIDILDSRDKLSAEVEAMTSHLKGSLIIATIPTLFNKIIPKALSAFKKDYPHINVEIFESSREDIIRLVENNEVDIGLIGIRDNEQLSSTITLHSLNRTSDFKLIVPKKSKLVLKDVVSLEEIQQYPFVLYDRSFYQHNFKEFEEVYGPLKIVFRTNNLGVVLRTVAEGLGVSIVSSLMLEEDLLIESGMIEQIPIGNPFDYYIYFTALTKGVQNKYSVANTFITYIKQ